MKNRESSDPIIRILQTDTPMHVPNSLTLWERHWLERLGLTEMGGPDTGSSTASTSNNKLDDMDAD
jgi:hypothetical protein